jgi:RNA polymerase sigma-70 factor, ECF subfamily
MFLIVLPDINTDDRLLLQLQRGDEQAVIAAYERYFPPLYQYARFKTGDSHLAQDIVSEVFVRLLESSGKRSAPRLNLRGWLFQVARHEIARGYGRVVQLPLTDVEEWMPAPTDTNPETLLGDAFDLERVRHALRMLTADHQEVLILRFGQRLSVKETADIMGKSESAVKSLLFRAIETLRSILLDPRAEAAIG